MLPDWLYNITSGLSEHRHMRILFETERHAIVQIPGGKWGDNSGTHYGPTTFFLVDKQVKLRQQVGLLDSEELQHGGRAKLAQWKLLIQEKEKTCSAQQLKQPPTITS